LLLLLLLLWLCVGVVLLRRRSVRRVARWGNWAAQVRVRRRARQLRLLLLLLLQWEHHSGRRQPTKLPSGH